MILTDCELLQPKRLDCFKFKLVVASLHMIDETNCKNTLNIYPRSSPGVEREDDPSSGCFMADVCVQAKISRYQESRRSMRDGTRCQLLCCEMGTETSKPRSRHVTQLVMVSRNTANAMTSPPATLVSSNYSFKSAKCLIYINMTKILWPKHSTQYSWDTRWRVKF